MKLDRKGTNFTSAGLVLFTAWNSAKFGSQYWCIVTSAVLQWQEKRKKKSSWL